MPTDEERVSYVRDNFGAAYARALADNLKRNDRKSTRIRRDLDQEIREAKGLSAWRKRV